MVVSNRETAVTYYKVKQIMLESELYEYYGIDWMKP